MTKNKNGNMKGSEADFPPHKLIATRNEWYKDSFKKVVSILCASIVVNVILVIVISYSFLTPVQPKYFATTDSGKIIPVISLDQPNTSSSNVIQFASDAAREAYSFDYVNYKNQLNKVGAIYFSAVGFDSFVKAITESGNLEAIKAKRLIVKTIVSGVPSITKQGVLNGRYSWRIEVPVKVFYKGSTMETVQDHIIAMTIQRMDVLKSSKGIGVIQFLVQ